MLTSEWPLSIKTRIDIEIQRLTDDLTTNHLQSIADNMHLVKQIAEDAKLEGNKRNGCLLWNPKKQAVVVSAKDQTQSSDTNIDHCCMALLQECASLLRATDDSNLGKHVLDADAYLCAGMHVFVYEEPCSLI